MSSEILTVCAIVDADGAVVATSSDELVPWWSFTKTLIAFCALQLVQDGKLSLDVPLAGAPYSLRQLLQHRAGVPDYGALSDYHAAVARDAEPWSDEEIKSRANASRLLFVPGTAFTYSNIGYLIVRRLIETAADASLSHVLQRYVFAPMALSRCALATTRADMEATVFGRKLSYHPGWVYHGVVVGPVSQAALALHRMMSDDYGIKGLRDEMLQGQFVCNEIPGRPVLRGSYGLGMMIGEWGDPSVAAEDGGVSRKSLAVVGHSAGGPGSAGAVYQHQSEPKQTVAVFSNAEDAAFPEWEALRLMKNSG